MNTPLLEVLGIGSLRDRSFLVYFSDQTYATVSSEKLAKCFPDRQTIPPSITDDLFDEPIYQASRAGRALHLHRQIQ